MSAPSFTNNSGGYTLTEHKAVEVDGRTLTVTEVVLVAQHNATVNVSEDAWPQIHAARAVVDRIVVENETVYGINTGFGALVHERISPGDLSQLQVNLVRSHATALGPAMGVEETRAMMLIRLNSLCKGHSGVHPNAINQLVTFLNEGLHPYIPRIGSLGASGDLAPLSHLAMALMGEGYVLGQENEKRPTKDVLFERGLLPLELTAKDGLSLINGTSQMSAYTALSASTLSDLFVLADIVLAMSMEARQCSLTPFRAEVHEARPHEGQKRVAQRVRTILKDSPILASHADCNRVQDPYSFRCAPQVHGAVYESLLDLQRMIDVEINSATDNPLIFPTPDRPGPHEVMSQGNFHGEVLAIRADQMALALFELASISERRMDQLLDHSRSGMPAFLAINSGLESGLMIVQYVAGASLAELRGHASPRSAFSTSTSAGQEDHVSMGATATYNLFAAVKRLSEVLACEALIAAEALEHAVQKPVNHVAGLYQLVRTISPPLTGDRSTSEELMSMAEAMVNGGWLARLESEHGRLVR